MTLDFSHKIQSTWRPQNHTLSPPLGMHTTSISPFCDARLSIVPSKSISVSSGGGERSFKVRKLLPESHVQLHTDTGHRSDESDDSDDDMFLDIDMAALRQRCKGTYSCPKAYQCKKGGVDKEGNLVVFDRNSSFAYVVDPDPHRLGLPRYVCEGAIPSSYTPRSAAFTEAHTASLIC